jgi:hypothetical protein
LFIPRHVYDALNARAIKAEAIVSQLQNENANLNAQMEWLRVRLTQLEFERASLINRYMGITIPVPQFEHANERVAPLTDPNQTIDFSDIGDEEAAKLGISWRPDGTLNYADR